MVAVPRWNTKATLHWAFVFAVNLPIPTAFAWMVYGNPYRPSSDAWMIAGSAAACIILFAIGFYFAGRSHRVMHRILVGGLILAMFQFLPCIQCVSGCCGLGLWNKIAKLYALEPQAAKHFLEGYVLTFFVGQCMLLVALGFGYWFEVSHRPERRD